MDLTDVRGSLMFQEILTLLTKHDFAEAFVIQVRLSETDFRYINVKMQQWEEKVEIPHLG